jgi:hypothetical protein
MGMKGKGTGCGIGGGREEKGANGGVGGVVCVGVWGGGRGRRCFNVGEFRVERLRSRYHEGLMYM